MAVIDITFQEDFRKIHNGDTAMIWNDIDASGKFPSIAADNVTLHGQGHTLRGLTAPLFDPSAMIGSTGDPATGEIIEPTVTNLTVCAEFTRDEPTDANYWGVFFRSAVRANIKNCHAYANIHATHDWVGGIAGALRDSTVECSSAHGEVTAFDGAAGISAFASNTRFAKCYNNARVTANMMNAGGIAAWATDRCVFDECVNMRDASVSARSAMVASSQAGGIAGRMDEAGTVRRSVNYAVISGNDNTGGLVGLATNAGANTQNIIMNNRNAGFVRGANRVGGIAGGVEGAALIADNNAASPVRGTGSQVGGIAGWVDPLGAATEVKNNQVGACEITGLSYVHRVIGDDSGSVMMTGNIASPGAKITGDNTAIDASIYYIEHVHDNDPQLGSYLKQGQSCDICWFNACQPPVVSCCHR